MAPPSAVLSIDLMGNAVGIAHVVALRYGPNGNPPHDF